MTVMMVLKVVVVVVEVVMMIMTMPREADRQAYDTERDSDSHLLECYGPN